MNDDRSSRLRDLFVALLPLSASDREAILASRCDDDLELRANVEQLLALHASSERCFSSPALNGHAPQQRPPCLVPTDEIGGFVVENLIAQGGTGDVFRARQISLGGRRVALKVIRVSDLDDGWRERFRREARIAASIHHPFLVDVFEFGDDPARGLSFYAMRLVEGPTLADVLSGLTLSPTGTRPKQACVVRWGRDVASGLTALHERGLVHRDVKPLNIVLDATEGSETWNRPAVLVDYGLVRPQAHERTTSLRWGTPLYAAPEQLLGQSIDARADVFALGLTLYDLLAARAPRERHRITNDAVPTLDELECGVDRSLARVVARATEPRREWRYASASDLAHDLQAWLDTGRCDASRISPLQRARRWVIRDPARAIRSSWRVLLLLMLVVVLSGLGLYSLEVLRQRNGLAVALAAGDLVEARRCCEALPAVLLPRSLAAAAAELRDGTSSHPLARVEQLLDRSADREAFEVAVAHLTDPMPGVQQCLGQLLVRAIRDRHHTTSDPLPAIALHFLDNPVRTASDTRGGGAWQQALLERLAMRDPSLFALTALSGCGDAAAITPLIAWTRSRIEHPQAMWEEQTRLALRAIDSIVRRSRSCGYRGAIGARWRMLVDLVNHAAEHAPSHSDGLLSSARDLAVLLLVTVRAAGLDAGTVQLHPLLDRERSIRAAREDDALRAELCSQPEMLLTYPLSADAEGGANTIGKLAGHYGDALVATDCERTLNLIVKANPFPLADITEAYRLGVAVAVDELSGLVADDPLATMRALTRASPKEMTIELTNGSGDGTAVIWDFEHMRPRRESPMLRVKLIAAVPAHDESHPYHTFVCLVRPGVACVRLPFVMPSSINSKELAVELSLQKANRELLPFLGDAGVEISIDGGRPVEREAPADQGHPSPILFLPRPPSSESNQHELTVRLDGRSTAMVRLYRVLVMWR